MDGLQPARSFTLFSYADTHQEAAYFGAVFKTLPDFLSDHTLLGSTPAERLAEALGRFERLAAGLRKFPDTAYALRFTGRPDLGEVEISLIGRLLGSPGSVSARAGAVAASLDQHLTAYGLPHTMLPWQPAHPGEPCLERALRPFNQPVHLAEIRQRMMPALMGQLPWKPATDEKNRTLILQPFWGPTGSGLEPFEALLRQPCPVTISVYLEPVPDVENQLKILDRLTAVYQTRMDISFQTQSDLSVQRWRDPVAEMAAQVYGAYRKSLIDPFYTVTQVAAPDMDAAWSVARTFASALVTRPTRDLAQVEERELPTGAELVRPANNEEQACAWRTFDRLVWSGGWGSSQPSTSEYAFMPYLVGARAAAATFRLPVSVQGGVPGVAVRQLPPDFEPGPRPNAAAKGELHLGKYQRGGAVIVPVKDLTRHALITGFTGSGKTNTVVYLLQQLWLKEGIPFLVIESAKKEYRSLLRVPGFEKLLVFTLGDETTSPFRLNPFELLPGIRLETHLGRLQSCFDAALPQFGILPSIIGEAMEEIYKARKWELTDTLQPNEKRAFPTLYDLLRETLLAVDRRGYTGETYFNIKAAAGGRIGSLLRGSRGRMYGAQRSLPAAEIFARPVILELDDLNEDDKALTMMFLLTWLREYRQMNRKRELQHLTVVEEAHNVLSNATPVGNTEVAPDTKARSVAAFANMLAEVRAYGEGLVISDQSPEKLAPDAMRNTNLQIAHQLRDRHDREAVARAMIMDEQQQEYLGKLRIGEAALFRTGIEKATFITVPEFKDTAGFDDIPDDRAVRKHMADFQTGHAQTMLPFDGCRLCKEPCQYRGTIEPRTREPDLHVEFIQALKGFDAHPEPQAWDENWRTVARVCLAAAERAGHPHKVDAAFCYLAHEIDFRFTEHMRKRFERAVDHLHPTERIIS